jgi:RND family efflux transporter MFP subunit
VTESMDLNRLRIPDSGPPPSPSRRWGVLLACAACLAAGAVASRLVAPAGPGGPSRVRTAVVRPPSAATGRGFTAGGWIEPQVPYHPVIVSARIPERLEELLVHEGQDVPPGAVVARLNDRDMRSRLALAEARLESARQQHALLKAGPRVEEIRAAEGRLAETDEQVRLARANVERSRGIQDGALSAEQLDAERAALARAEAVRAQALADLDRLRTGYRAEEVAVARAAETAAAAEADLARRGLDYCTLRAPASDRPLRVLRVFRPVGSWINAEKSEETAVLSLYDPKAMQVRVDVTQPNLRAVAAGGKADVVTEANPSRTYRGTVLRCEPMAVLAKNTVTVRVRIEDPDDLLFPDMVAQVTFLRAGEAGAPARELLVPKEALLDPAPPAPGGRNAVFVVIDGRAQRRPVVLQGVRGDQVLVGEGLDSGQRVVVSGAGALREGQAVSDGE